MSEVASQPFLTLDAAWVVTMDGPPIRRGRLVVHGDRIAAVGPLERIAPQGRHIRLDEAILLPGLINAHCHLELSAYHGAIPSGSLWDWFPRLVALRSRADASTSEQAAIGPAVQSLLANGTTCVGDISRAAWLPGALTGLPIRKVCYVELISGVPSPPNTPKQLRRRLDDWPKGDALLHPAISPHTPYTVTREDLRACAQLAGLRRLPLAIHLAETPEEIEWLRSGTGRIRQWHERFWPNLPRCPATGPTQYVRQTLLAQQTAGDDRAPAAAALIHMNYADDWRQLLAIPADRRPVVVYCPRSHRFFGHEPHPFRQMLQAGLRVAVGTDSAASQAADDPAPLSILAELRWLWQQGADLAPEQLVAMATTHAAAALGMGGTIGRLAPGFQADLAAFALHNADTTDPLRELLAGNAPAVYVCAGGRDASHWRHDRPSAEHSAADAR